MQFSLSVFQVTVPPTSRQTSKYRQQRMATGTIDLYVRGRAGKAALDLAAGPDRRPEPGRFVQRPSQRQPELDALRGLMLLWMTVTHLPTQASHYSYQPLGFVAAAEGFIFISALLAGKSFGQLLESARFTQVVKRIWARAGRLFAYHCVCSASRSRL
jgi:hypothetical protein